MYSKIQYYAVGYCQIRPDSIRFSRIRSDLVNGMHVSFLTFVLGYGQLVDICNCCFVLLGEINDDDDDDDCRTRMKHYFGRI